MCGSLLEYETSRRLESCNTAALAVLLISATYAPLVGHAQSGVLPQTQAVESFTEAVEPPLAVGEPSTEAAPEWAVWRAFYGSLDYYGQQSALAVQELLLERSGLTATEAGVVQGAGREYLSELALIDQQARTDISARFARRSDSPSEAARPEIPAEVVARGLIPARAADGRLVYDILAEEGFIENIEEQRRAAFRKHWNTLARTIGLGKLISLERFIETDVAANVRVATRGVPVPSSHSVIQPPAELPTR